MATHMEHKQDLIISRQVEKQSKEKRAEQEKKIYASTPHPSYLPSPQRRNQPGPLPSGPAEEMAQMQYP